MRQSVQNTIGAYDMPMVLTPDEELELAVAILLNPGLFKNMDAKLGWVPKERARQLRRARRLISFLCIYDSK